MVISFAPVFLLEGQEGRMFRPLALTKTFGVAAASLLAITLVPAMMLLFLERKPRTPGEHNPVAILHPIVRTNASAGAATQAGIPRVQCSNSAGGGRAHPETRQ